jgi:predicted MFS family arabinose efflux permease
MLDAMPDAERSHPNLTLAVLSLGGLSYAFMSSAVVPALPTIQHDLHASETGVTWLLTGYLLAASVPPHQTGVATGMNTVMRTLGGALGGQLAATFIADNVSGGYPTVTGFTDTFVMATAFLTVCLGTAFLVPTVRPRRRGSVEPLPTVAKDAA